MYQEEEHLHFSNSSTTYAMKGAIFWSLLFLAETVMDTAELLSVKKENEQNSGKGKSKVAREKVC